MKLIAVKDMKSQLFLKPHFENSLADATRSFEVMANEGENMLSKFPHDFRLMHLANFDIETGILSPLDLATDLGSVADYQRKAPIQDTLPFKQVN